MTAVLLNPGDAGNYRAAYTTATVPSGLTMTLDVSAASSINVTYATTGTSTSTSVSAPMTYLHLKTNLANAFSVSGAQFTQGVRDYMVKATAEIQVALSPVTGIGTTVGAMTPAQGEMVLNAWVAGTTPAVTNWRGVAGAPVNGPDTPFSTYAVTFRVATAPLRTGSLTVLGTMKDGTTFNVAADSNGYINQTRIKGRVNYTTGVVVLVGVTPTGTGGQTSTSLAFLGIPGVDACFIDLIQQETLRYNAVAYTYLPLDATLLGIDPVRLPTDGRVPIFRPGGSVVVGHTATTTPATASNGGTVNTGRTRLSRVRVIGNDNATIVNGYSVDLEAGVVTWSNVTGYAQPVRVESRIEDMAQILDAQINGQLSLMRPLTHAFPTGSYISSALVVNDLRARTSLTFDQASWDGVTFSDVVVGNPSAATYNDTAYPIVVSNAGALTERWALQFTSTQSFNIVGEHVGVIATGSINTLTAPTNPNTGQPYFTIQTLGWGTGWSIGNILRINTIGAMVPLWLARTIKQGPEAGGDYKFSVLVRGNIDNPIS